MKLTIFTTSEKDYYEIKVIRNIERITSYNYITENGTMTPCFLYQLKGKKYSLFDKEEYILDPCYDYVIEEDDNAS